ncbi:MAG: DNA repair protein RecN [Ruminococcaceae bacterium]|nr:DNA repair protein RecN [Oscillospiraceae bacterium]
MLISLHIENVAVIRRADIDFHGGLCVLTGETGAGKSLLIDSINLLTGGRVNREIIRSGEDKALISALFSPPEGDTAEAILALGIDLPEGDSLMLQRVITRDGRSTARINGRAVTQGMLKEVGELLINIHGQSDNQKLMQPSAHRALLDNYAQNADELKQYTETYARFKSVRDEITRLKSDVAERIRTREMLAFQIADIDAAKLRIGEEEKLTERRDKLLHLEKINRQVSVACRVLCDGEKATVTTLCDRATAALEQIAPLLPECDGLMERISSIRAEAEDIAECIREFGDEDVDDPTAELDRIESRLDLISRLGRKYGEGVAEILAFRENASLRLFEIDTADERIEELAEEENKLTLLLEKEAQRLTSIRMAAAASLSSAVQESLTFLDMPKVRFVVSVTPTPMFTPEGRDDVAFLISTNPGEPLQPMVRIASGGELSRIMLAVRSVLNERYGVPTAIYDEVDTGISGRTARKVGIKLAAIAGGTQNILGERRGTGTQVICVTHSAQIASLADAHYVIEKQDKPMSDGTFRTETSVREIEDCDRVEEIARILGGLDVTDAQRAAARELIAERNAL